jgi:hypothetical protein
VAEAGLAVHRDIDLTDQVPDRGSKARERARRRLTALRRITPLAGPRRVLDAFLGGLALERLYARDRMRYRVLVARRREGSAGT